LDRDLTEATASLTGLVLDLGGEWLQRRGTFRPPKRPDLRWLCINLNPTAALDILADVAHVPFADACADAVVCTEVLEHVPRPERVIAEAYRVLKLGGRLILSMPFLARIHGDPDDYQRYTARKLEYLLRDTGFTEIVIRPQGLYFTVLGDMLRSLANRTRPALLRWALKAFLEPLGVCLRHLERKLRSNSSPYLSSYVAGYFVTAHRPPR